ncbi:ubiquitin carboxyl-terminal hydrolase 25 isoform X1 [Ixodes scapularis]|uniref:ubiquitin carboxyl-terminal hydrolase 25 isoform X1 n=1 Tax=Ixodes scapularis TaxID=6945 RepID=UPI001A9DAB18|nr:ubiquitin carboxyl-terminal hydrolase 25 isoform X1 [Ixodes scapularis]
MTVEHSSLDNHCKKQQREETARLVLSQLKEITGVEDAAILEQALEASRTRSGDYDLSQAVSMLVDEDATASPAASTHGTQVAAKPELSGDGVALTSNNGGPSSSPQKRPAKVIDLTAAEGDDLQKAIALSLQEQQVAGVSAEEQDISRALEQSLGSGGKRKRGADAWQDPANPHERRRQGDWPVGIKNVGNTCWFSAVMQSLFHLRVFRRLVLAFEPVSVPSGQPAQERRSLGLMQELRPLFALLGATRRKYVDPGRALELLREAFAGSGAGAQGGSQGQPAPAAQSQQQQDVSEFTHKLLEWLEEAFQLARCSPASEVGMPKLDQTNPMLDLFYGRFRCEGESEGLRFSREEAFGQYPLQVSGFSDIHESLEAATTNLEPEALTAPGMRRLGQESWFTKLPPVLVFELSRFRFNQQLGKPEKIHHQLDFPEQLYLDRYMEYNKNITRSKREEVRRLKAEWERLHKCLNKYIQYGSGPKRVPLQDVLQYTLEFVETKAAMHKAEDVEMGSPSSSLGLGSPSSSPPDEGHARDQSPRSSFDGGPRPRHVAEPELRMLQTCLRRWRTEVEHDVKELQDSMSRIQATIKDIYNEPSLLQVPYRLHAVLVHEGQAASGHYWAFVYCPRRSVWLKFNDVTVTEVSWAELVRDSVGGHHCTSAYCLLYVDRNNRDLFDEVKDSELELPSDLAQFVEEDNEAFRRELEQWDRSHKDCPDGASSDIVVTPLQQQKESPAAERVCSAAEWSVSGTAVPWPEVQLEHARLAQGSFQGVRLAQLVPTLTTEGPRAALAKALDQELARLQRLAKHAPCGEASQEPRLHHPGLFLLLNGIPVQPHLRRVLLEQFAHPDLEGDPTGRLLRQEALQCLAQLRGGSESEEAAEEAAYRGWHALYARFRQLATALAVGLDRLWAGRLPEALSLLAGACALNEALQGGPPPAGPKARHLGLNPRLLDHCRRLALLELNEKCASQFEEGSLEEGLEALRLMSQAVLPCLAPLLAPQASSRDARAIEEVRSRWCAMLGLAMTEEKQERLQELLSKLLDPGAELPVPAVAPLTVPRLPDLGAAFETAMRRLTASGQLEAALSSAS